MTTGSEDRVLTRVDEDPITGCLPSVAPAALSSRTVAAETFWKSEFPSIPDLIDLPVDFPRRAERTSAAATCSEQLPLELSRALLSEGVSQDGNLFVTLFGAWQILLSRLSGQQEPVTLIPSASGCLTLLPIRSSVNSDRSAAAFLCEVKRAVLKAREHQEIRYGSLLHILKATAPAGRLPLSEVQFNFESVDGSGQKTPIAPNGKRQVYFDLSLNIVESSYGLRLECDYNADLFREDTILLWLSHYTTLLEGLAADITTALGDLPLLDAGLRHSLLVQFNDTAQPYPHASSIPELIRRQADAAPDSIAVEFYGRSLTRRQLEEHSDRVAAALRARAIGTGSLVGIYVDRSIDMLVALLGILKSGAAYVPLDRLLPKERIHIILRNTKMSLLLTLDSHLDELPDNSAPKLTMREALKTQPADSAHVNMPTPDSTAYVVFTSGSTGIPKGVEITHRSVINLLYAAAKEIGFRQNDRLLAVTTLTFDIAALELFMPLVLGGTVVIARRQDSSDGMRLLDLVRTSVPDVMQATPITWRMLLEAGFCSWPGFKMLCGGEAWTRELADALLGGGGRLWNMYGPTETTIWSSITKVLPGVGPVAIERPLANTQFYVLDERMHPAPPGVTGELYIGGDGLARGYHRSPELTQARFLPNPFLHAEAARVYKTGDLVRQSPDGSIQFLGRADHQTKIRGFRIELGEIENAIMTSAPAAQVVVMPRENPSGNPALVAYVIPRQKVEFDIEALRAALFKLPDYMIPSSFVVLEKFPLTANGKIDRKALPPPNWHRVHRTAVPPRTDLEHALVAIWREVFHLGTIGVEDDFFELGGDSLMLARIQARLKKASGHRIMAADIISEPTIAGLAKRLDGTPDRPLMSRIVPLRAEGSQPPLFLASQGMVFRRMVQWLHPSQPVFTVVMHYQDLANGDRSTFEQIASYYVSLIRSVRPRGPYRVGGWCISSSLAYEIARQLQAAGETVDFLLLVDGWAPGYWRRIGYAKRLCAGVSYARAHAMRRVHSLARASFAERRAYFFEKWRILRTTIAHVLGTIFPSVIVTINDGIDEQNTHVDRVVYSASRNYKPHPADFPALVFRSEGEPQTRFLPPDLGWSGLLQRDVTAIPLAGDHRGILNEPGAQMIAQEIATFLSFQPVAHGDPRVPFSQEAAAL